MPTFQTALRGAALWAIRSYQRYLSPYKGFSCAFRAHTGRDSCSAYGYRVIARHGVWRGLALLDRRLCACGVKHRLHAPPALPHKHGAFRHQAGFCDLPCDLPCDGPCDSPGGGKGMGGAAQCACDALSNCGCDVFDKWREKRKQRRRDGK